MDLNSFENFSQQTKQNKLFEKRNRYRKYLIGCLNELLNINNKSELLDALQHSDFDIKDSLKSRTVEYIHKNIARVKRQLEEISNGVVLVDSAKTVKYKRNLHSQFKPFAAPQGSTKNISELLNVSSEEDVVTLINVFHQYKISKCTLNEIKYTLRCMKKSKLSIPEYVLSMKDACLRTGYIVYALIDQNIIADYYFGGISAELIRTLKKISKREGRELQSDYFK